MERSNYETTRNALDKLRRKDEMLFRMAISHWTDVGTRNLTESNIEATCKSMMKEDDSHAFMTNEYKCALVRMAGEIAKFDHVHVLVYIQNELTYDVGQKEMNRDRMLNLLTSMAESLTENWQTSDIYKVMHIFLGMTHDEIEEIGFSWVIPENAVDDDDDE